MKKHLLSIALSAVLLVGAAEQAGAGIPQPTRNHYVQRHHYVHHRASAKHRRHVKTAKRVGIGAAGGAAIGALAGGGKGAGIGAIAGAGAGALYDRHRRHKER